jgi:polyhydroxyalkanoate synthase
MLFVPSLINPPSVLDLTEHNSLLRWLSTQGVSPLLLDWGTPEPNERELSIAGHVEDYILPILKALDEPPILAGYCLGGTMAAAAAARLPVKALVLIASPWQFQNFPGDTRKRLAALWEESRVGAEYLGMLPMEILQTAFWGLDPASMIAKFEKFAHVEPDSEKARGFVALEDWANDGPPLTAAAAQDLLIGFMRDNLPGAGSWNVAGAPVLLEDILCPVLNIASTQDRIVPASTAPAIGEQRLLSLGHVGMIVGSRAREALWHPLAEWLLRLRDR